MFGVGGGLFFLYNVWDVFQCLRLVLENLEPVRFFFSLYIICMHIYNYLRTYRFHFYYTDICIYIYFITTNYSDHEFWRRRNLYLYYGCTCFMLWRNSLKVLLWLRAGSINWRAINTIYRNFTRGICVILYRKKNTEHLFYI